MEPVFDVAIIGGGINGCGCAADAALRGLSVVLLEKDDLASKTSSSSTKLIHGGLRYLEHYQFSLVKKALEERQRLIRLAPHIVHPQAFVLAHQKQMRPAWLLRMGLFFYDHLSRANHLPRCQSIHRSSKNNYFTPLVDAFQRGFLFYDATTDDSRLTIANALLAKEHGASIRTHSMVMATEIVDKTWRISIQPKNQKRYSIYAKTLINAAGPWVGAIANMTHIPAVRKLTLVKGSHIVVPRLYEGNQAYLLQHPDNRVVFVLPYCGHTLIGTTDVACTEPLDQVHISEEEISYLCALVNSYFKTALSAKDIIYSWSGIRPLVDDGKKEISAITRDYSYHYNTQPAKIITIYGGKITTYRQLAEEIINTLAPSFAHIHPCSTRNTELPGASLNGMSFVEYIHYAKERYQWLEPMLLQRYLHTYGTNTEYFLAHCTSMKSLGRRFGPSLYQVEVDYLVREEWAVDADDILLRRTKLIYEIDKAGREQLSAYLTGAEVLEI